MHETSHYTESIYYSRFTISATFNLLTSASIAHVQPTSDDYYWLVASDGGIFSFGGAGYYGSTGNIKLNQPIVGMSPTDSGNGYWLVASDGGIFAFGDAQYKGSPAESKMNEYSKGITLKSRELKVVGVVRYLSGDEDGYMVYGSQAGLSGYDAPSMYLFNGRPAGYDVVGFAPKPYDGNGHGGWFVTHDGGIYSSGNAVFRGSLGATKLNKPIVGIASQFYSVDEYLDYHGIE